MIMHEALNVFPIAQPAGLAQLPIDHPIVGILQCKTYSAPFGLHSCVGDDNIVLTIYSTWSYSIKRLSNSSTLIFCSYMNSAHPVVIIDFLQSNLVFH